MKPEPAKAYAAFGSVLRRDRSRRRLLFNICNFLRPNSLGPNYPPLERSAFFSYTFGPRTGNSWRTDTDIGFPHEVVFANALRNLDSDAAHPEAAGPGHWNDPDYLAPQLGMSAVEARAQFSMWAIVAAPLIIGSDVRRLSRATSAMLTNREVIAIDQDPLGVKGASHDGRGEVWVKPLVSGDRAVALLNRGSEPATIATTATASGLRAAQRYALRDVWAHQTTITTGAIDAIVPAHGVVLYRVSAAGG